MQRLQLAAFFAAIFGSISAGPTIAQTNPNPPAAQANPFVGSWVVQETETAMYDNTGQPVRLALKPEPARSAWEITFENGQFEIKQDGQQLTLADLQYNGHELSFNSNKTGLGYSYSPTGGGLISKYYLKVAGDGHVIGQIRSGPSDPAVSATTPTVDISVDMTRLSIGPAFPTVAPPPPPPVPTPGSPPGH